MKLLRVRVWDLPTRLFHWLLLAAVAGQFITAYAPGNWIEWHARGGYAIVALLLFRLVWGFIGGRWSRFASFLPSPGRLLAYLRGEDSALHRLGHNPLGALSVIAMLLVLAAQVATGLVSDDEISFTGPLNRLVSSDLGLAATGWHKGWGTWLIIGLVALHVVAVLYYRLVRRDDLIGPMVHGDKRLTQPGDAPADVLPEGSRDTLGLRLLAALVLASCAGGVWWMVTTAQAS